MAFPLHRVALAACLCLLACRPDTTRPHQGPPPAPACGDGFVDPGEECDGENLGTATCESLGFDTGTVSCDAECKRVTAACVKHCGDGTVDLGEQCDDKAGPLDCPTFGAKRCTAACAIDDSHCVTQPFAPAPALQLAKGGPAIIADLSPTGFGDLVVAVPSYLRLETFPYTVAQGFVAGRKLSFGSVPVAALAGDLDGDGQVDLAGLNADGTVDRYRYLPASNSFTPERYPAPDGGFVCPAAAWVGVMRGPGAAADDLVALGCATATSPPTAQALLVYRAGATATVPIQLPHLGILAAALGDVDGDGLADLAFVDGTAPELNWLRAEPPGFAAGTPLPLPATPSALAAGDLGGDGKLCLAVIEGPNVKVLENTGAAFVERAAFAQTGAIGLQLLDADLDGRLDVVWLDGDTLRVRRNAGNFAFTAYDATTGQGTPLSLAAGDVDGDGDPDFAATYGQGADATVTYLVLNKVR